LGSSPFARHYSGSRGFFPFLPVLRCFSSRACRHPAYGFSWEHTRITAHRFPHSEIAGSKVGQHLPRAYRSRPRPSSALGAKASTVRSCSLDRKEHVMCRYGVFKVRVGNANRPPRGRSFKTQQHAKRRGRHCSRRARFPDDMCAINGRAASGVIAPESLERR
jgi:hypothetical protein